LELKATGSVFRILVQNSSYAHSITACKSYTWINGLTYTSNNTTSKDTLVNASGCDSVVSLNLTIVSINKLVSKSIITLTSNEAGASYKWLDCDSAFSEISGENLQTFIPSKNGNYAVEITKIGCIDTSSCQPVNSVGISEKGLINLVKLFPNPITEEFKLVFFSQQTLTVSIIDIQGKLLESRKVSGENTEVFSLSNVTAGVYFVKIENQNELIYLKVVKQ